MQKIRTHSGTAKRVKVTSTGKIKHGKAYSSHFLEKKSASRKRGFAVKSILKGRAKTNVKRALGA